MDCADLSAFAQTKDNLMCDHNPNNTAADRSPDIKALLEGLPTNWGK
jgi:hypothetical protein